MAREFKTFWPPPKMPLIVAEIEWPDLLSEHSEVHSWIQHTTMDSDTLKQLHAHHQILRTIIPNSTEWHGPDNLIPFLFKPAKGKARLFTGVGTNNLAHAQRCCLYGYIAFFWNAATLHPFGSEHMVKNLSAALRCYYLTDNRIVSARTSTDPEATDGYYYNMTKIWLVLVKYTISTRPPVQVQGAALLDLIRVLNTLLIWCHDIICPSAHVTLFKTLHTRLIQELYLCCGVYIQQEKALPFTEPAGYATTTDTALLLKESMACLQLSPPCAQKYIALVGRQLDAGYSLESTAKPDQYKVFNTQAFWNAHPATHTLVDVVLARATLANQWDKLVEFIATH
jgi:hypothetical protein